MNEAITIPIMLGLLATLMAVLIAVWWQWTGANERDERNALRWATVAALLSAAVVGVGEWWLYNVSSTLGFFMLAPAVALGCVAMWFTARSVYFARGGGKNQEALGRTIEVEKETLEHQGAIWCQMRDMPHFRETLGGELINLATGDRLYWSKIGDMKCIEMELSGRTLLVASRYETLGKYLAVQVGVARLLFDPV
jgi:hypothetical protein